eukprot:892107-Pleurochrysis_carterae.AAC.1
MSFNAGGDFRMQQLWYGALVGPEIAGANGHYCGFDDGENRLVSFDEVRAGLEMGFVSALTGEGGLCGEK